jgi:hypothetical protein
MGQGKFCMTNVAKYLPLSTPEEVSMPDWESTPGRSVETDPAGGLT